MAEYVVEGVLTKLLLFPVIPKPKVHKLFDVIPISCWEIGRFEKLITLFVVDITLAT